MTKDELGDKQMLQAQCLAEAIIGLRFKLLNNSDCSCSNCINLHSVLQHAS